MSEARIDHLEALIDRLEARLARIEHAVIRIEERLAATQPPLAINAELAGKPSRHYNWSVRTAMIAAYTVALAAEATGALVLTHSPHH
jgi:hypothetical protein